MCSSNYWECGCLLETTVHRWTRPLSSSLLTFCSTGQKNCVLNVGLLSCIHSVTAHLEWLWPDGVQRPAASGGPFDSTSFQLLWTISDQFFLPCGSFVSTVAQIHTHKRCRTVSHACACFSVFVSANAQSSALEQRMMKTKLRLRSESSRLSWAEAVFDVSPGFLLFLCCKRFFPAETKSLYFSQRSEERLGMRRCGPSTAGLSPPAHPPPPLPPFQTTDKSHLKDLLFFWRWWELRDKLGTEVNTRPSPGNREFPACSDMTGQGLWRSQGVCLLFEVSAVLFSSNIAINCSIILEKIPELRLVYKMCRI